MTSLAECLDTYLQIPRAPTTVTNYRKCLTLFVGAVGANRAISLITHADLIRYTNHLCSTHKASSVVQYITIIKGFFNWLVRTGQLTHTPAAGLTAPKVEIDPTQVRAIPTELLLQMRELARRNARDESMLLFFADSASRRGAVARLQISRLDLVQGQAVVREKGGVYCEVYFGEETAGVMKKWLARRPRVEHDYVFTSIRKGNPPLTPNGVSDVIRRLAERAGEVYGPHSLRHWVAQEWIEAGETPNTVQHKLNHKRLSSTLHYFPKHNRYVKEASQRLSLGALRKSSPGELPPYIIPLEDAG